MRCKIAPSKEVQYSSSIVADVLMELISSKKTYTEEEFRELLNKVSEEHESSKED